VASSAIDISDGLAKELHLLAEMSGVGIEVYPERLPIGEGVGEVAELLGLDPVEVALASGEEFELVFTASRKDLEILNFKFSVIGKVIPERKVVLVDKNGRRLLPRLGWEHFDRGLFR